MTTHARHCLAILAASFLAACVDQPLFPRGGTPTLDDVGQGDYVAVSAGLAHTCALTSDGTAFCWGSNEFDQLGAPTSTTCARDANEIPCSLRPVPVNSALKFITISAGGQHTCGIATDGRTYCWGDNLQGGLGNPAFRSSDVPVPVISAATFSQVVAGGRHTCALRIDGFAFCWGANEAGQLGFLVAGFGSAVPDSVRANIRFASLAAGAQRTCGRSGDGATFCWGLTWVANLNGSDLTRAQTPPVRVIPAPPFKSLTVGTSVTCGISTQTQTSFENASHCWEGNTAGALGDGTVGGSASPRAVLGDLRFVAVASGAMHTCAIADSGFAYCWGAGSFGQLGMSSGVLDRRCGPSIVPCVTIPVRISGFRQFAQLSAGQGNHTCGLTIAGNVYCWGAGGMGQRGDGRASFGEWSPVRISPPATP